MHRARRHLQVEAAEDCKHAGSAPTLPGCKRKRAASVKAAHHLVSRACSHHCLAGYAAATFPTSNCDPATQANQRILVAAVPSSCGALWRRGPRTVR
jgi:hypothetical protein